MSSVTVMTGPERRRRWPVEARAAILEALSAPGASVADVARRFDVCTSLIYKWRRDASLMSGAGGFLPAMIVDDPQHGPVGGRRSSEAAVLIELVGGTRVSIGSHASAALVTAALRALR